MDRFDEQALADRFDTKQWNRVIRYLKPYRKHFYFLLFAAIGTGIFDAVFPLMTRYAISEFITKRTSDGIIKFTVRFIVLAFLQCILNVIYSKESITIEMNVDRDLRYDIFSHVQELSLDYFNETPVGYILSRVMSDTDKIGAAFSWVASNILWNTAYVIAAMGNMLILNSKLAFTVLFCIPPLYILSAVYQKKLLKANRDVRRQNSKVTVSYNENITGAVTIKELDARDKIISEFTRINREMQKKSMHTRMMERDFYPCIILISCTGLAIVLGMAPGLVSKGVLDVASMAVFITYACNLLSPVEEITRSVTNIMAMQANVERINALLDTAPTVTDSHDVIEKYGSIYKPKTENYEKIKGDIEFRDVSFKYPGSDKYVLEHFNLKIDSGKCVAIVGATGAGKSTLVNLVCRFYEVTDGQILIDGKDIRDRSYLWLESQLSYVLQTPHLFSGTIADNIRYSDINAPMEKVRAAAIRAQRDNFIQKLPDGYDTDVGQGGDRLSTGQKQLISIARAILADGRILVMDEATSSVDTQTEQMINSVTGDLLKGRTSFIIAHRLSTVRNADVIIVVDDGQIMEMGTHTQLLRREGMYYRMYTGQWEEKRQEDFFRSLHDL